MLVAIGGGIFAWAIGSRISTDAVAMGVGLIFGVLAGIPTALMVMAASARGSSNGYDAGYAAGQHEAHRQMLEHEARRQLMQPQYSPARPFALPPVIVVDPPVDDDDDDIEPYFNIAYPFGRGPLGGRQFRIEGEVER